MKQSTKFSYLAAIALSLAFGCASFVAIAKNENAAKNEKTVKAEKSTQGQEQKQIKTTQPGTALTTTTTPGVLEVTATELKNFEKPNKTTGETNAQLHKEKSEEITKNLKAVADDAQASGNTEVSEQIEQVAEAQAQVQEETTAAIEEVEGQGKIKTFLVGTSYKNLGQLRSSLVHNRNQIRQLTGALALAQTDEQKAAIETQLAALTQERERIKTVITTNESSFSLFGWVSRFLTNYEQTPVDNEEETQLTEDVADAIENADTTTTGTETTTDTGTTTDTATGTGADTTTETGTTTGADTTTGTTTATETTTAQ